VSVTQISVKFTAEELKLLASLASDQLFRREFIEPKLPGFRANPQDLSLGKQLVERLKESAGSSGVNGKPHKRAMGQ
jgi:hypothetical protein